MLNYKGATAYLCCGGPSLNRYDLAILNARSLVAAVNNAPVAMWRRGHVRPAVWFSIDSPHRFHSDIFSDPMTVKFVWQRFCEGNLHVGEGERGQWKAARHDVRQRKGGALVPWQPATEFPNVQTYDLTAVETVADFARSDKPVRTIGRRHSVLFAALWSLNRMGCRRVNLLGCDLHCDPADPYAWEQEKSATAADDLNEVLHWLRDTGLQEISRAFADRGTEVARIGPEAFGQELRAEQEWRRFVRADGLYSNA